MGKYIENIFQLCSEGNELKKYNSELFLKDLTFIHTAYSLLFVGDLISLYSR